jgi:hypothetical protein
VNTTLQDPVTNQLTPSLSTARCGRAGDNLIKHTGNVDRLRRHGGYAKPQNAAIEQILGDRQLYRNPPAGHGLHRIDIQILRVEDNVLTRACRS